MGAKVGPELTPPLRQHPKWVGLFKNFIHGKDLAHWNFIANSITRLFPTAPYSL